MILLTGATGFVGRAILRKLLAAGRMARAVARNAGHRRLATHENLTWIEGDLLAPETLRTAFDGVEAVIHLVGILVEDRKRSYEAMHHHATASMVAMARNAGVRRFIQMSALGARDDAPSAYHRTKAAGEAAVRSSRLEWTIFRPSLIYGEEDRFTTVFSRIINLSPVIPLIGRSPRPLQPIWVEDVADYFASALNMPTTFARAYELGGPKTYTMESIIDRILDVKSKKRLKLRLPMGWMRFQAAIMENILPSPPLTRDVLVMMEEDNVVTDDAALRDFPIRPASIETVLPRYIR